MRSVKKVDIQYMFDVCVTRRQFSLKFSRCIGWKLFGNGWIYRKRFCGSTERDYAVLLMSKWEFYSLEISSVSLVDGLNDVGGFLPKYPIRLG